MPGFDKNKFIISGEELENYLCGICLGVFNDPVFSRCCRQTYCRVCLTEWIIREKIPVLMIDKFGIQTIF